MPKTPLLDVTPPVVESISSEQVQQDRASRSIFKNLFARRRLSPSPTIATDHSNSSVSTAASLSQGQRQERRSGQARNTLSPRLDSESALFAASTPDLTLRVHSKALPLASNPAESRSFHHAYSRASLRSSLQVPVKGFFGRLPSTPSLRPSTSTADVSPAASRRSSANGLNVNPGDSQAVLSALSGSFAEKVFVLDSSGVILQFKVDGPPDRLPEKVIQLSAESIVFPSDVIPGKPTVLEIALIPDLTEQPRPKTNRSTWSKNPFRTSVSKRSAENHLIVFESSELMSTWLSAIRKEIACLGGSASRPLSASVTGDSQSSTVRSSSTERFSLRQSFLHLSRSTTSLRKEFAEPLNTGKELPHLPLPPPYQRTMSSRSVAASSVATTTSLDRLRESDTGSTTTGATNSLDGSFTLESPVKESFASLASPVPSLEPLSSPLPERHSSKVAMPVGRTIRERRKSSVGQLRLASASLVGSRPAMPPNGTSETTEPAADNGPTTDKVNTSIPSTNARPVSIVPPLPSPDDIKRPSHLVRTRSADCMGSEEELKLASGPLSGHAAHRSKHSVDAASKSMYSLFPKKRVEQAKAEPLMVPELTNIPGLPHTHATDHLDLPPTPTVAVTPAADPSEPRVVSKRPSPLKLLAPFDIDQPQRSPAVSDDMLASNFGTLGSKPLLSPVSPREILVPTFDDLKFDFSFLRQDSDNTIRRRSNSPSSDRSDGSLRRQKSTPNLRVSRAPSAPLGPPPTGPLPAVPAAETASTNSGSPREKRASDRPKSSRSGHSPPRPPSSFHKQKAPSQNIVTAALPARRSSATAQEKLSTEVTDPLAPVGRPSIIAPPPFVPHRMDDRQKSRSKSSSSIQTHRRAKSSGKCSMSTNMKAFPTAPILCDKPDQYLC